MKPGSDRPWAAWRSVWGKYIPVAYYDWSMHDLVMTSWDQILVNTPTLLIATTEDRADLIVMWLEPT